MDLETSPGTLPGHYLLASASADKPEGYREDVVSRGTISLTSAESYCTAYRDFLDHFLYGILMTYHSSTTSIASVRQASAGLTTAVCTVGALYLASPDFDVLYKEFVAYSAGLSLAKRFTVNDVRALGIGAFWLGDLSWSLIGIAVRLATELQLHRSFQKALDGDHEHRLRVRLYFLVYICDHHFSIPYGRPPMTRECEAVRNARKFLDSEQATEDDARLVSQVLRWSVCSNIYDTFGANVERPLADDDIPRMRRFNIALESLRAEWSDQFVVNTHVGNYPRKGSHLQYHFAKLYLGSHAVRGDQSGLFARKDFSENLDIDELVNTAIISATSIVRTVISDTELQSYLNGLPTYFHTMIMFAIVFLLKLSIRYSGSVQLDVREVQRLLVSLVAVLKQVTQSMHPHHLLVNITNGIEQVLHSSRLTGDHIFAPDSADSTAPGITQTLLQPDTIPGDFGFLSSDVLNQAIITDYDMLFG